MSMNPNIGFVPRLSLGQRLRVARETTGLDQQDFAKELGTSRQTVSAVERGVNEPRNILMRAWAMRTGVDLHWLATGQENTPSPDGDGAALPERPRRGSNPRPTAYNVAQIFGNEPRRIAA